MATTNAQLASAAVDSLMEAGVRMAFLHKEGEAARGEIHSDVDLLVDQSPTDVLKAAAPRWATHGLLPVLAFEYDLDCTTIWLSTADARDGVQLDLTYDRSGRSRFGASTAWLAEAAPGSRWPVVTPARQWEYRIRKSEQKARGRRIRSTDLPRAARRLRDPVGYWVHLEQPRRTVEIDRVVQRFGAFLPGVTCTEWATGRAFDAIAHRVQATAARLRSRLVVSWAAGPNGAADVSLSEPDGLPERIVCAMHGRFVSRFGPW